MNKKLHYKLSIDLLMFSLFLGLMVYPLTGNNTHEILGVLFLILLINHNWLNWRWYKSLLKGKYNLIRTIHTITNLLMLSLILFTFITAIGISHWLLAFLDLDWGLSGRQLHVLFAYWGMILLAIHVGIHWDMLMAIASRTCQLTTLNRYRRYSLRAATVIMASYGIYASFKLEIGAKLILYYSYFFWDDNQSSLLLLIDYLAIFSLYISLTHYDLKLLRYFRHR